VYKRIRVFEMAGSLGAEIHDVDFAKLDPADEETRAEIRQAFHDNGVIFFRNQWLTPQQHKAAAAILGKFDKHPIVKGSEDHPEILVVTRLPNQPCTFGEVTLHLKVEFRL
jgi:taurine dioxygenase